MKLRVMPRYRIEDFSDWLDVVCHPEVRETNRKLLLMQFDLAHKLALIRRQLRVKRYCRFTPQWSSAFKEK